MFDIFDTYEQKSNVDNNIYCCAAAAEDKEDDDTGDAHESELLCSEATAAETSTVTVVERQPTARIVGIVRRKWRQYCGILKPSLLAMVRQ